MEFGKSPVDYIHSVLSKFERHNGQVTLRGFKDALGISGELFFCDRLFHILDSDNRGFVGNADMLAAFTTLFEGTPANKLQLIFTIYDVNGDGVLDKNEVTDILDMCMTDSCITLTDSMLDQLVVAILEETESQDAITYQSLETELLKHNELIDNLNHNLCLLLNLPVTSKSNTYTTTTSRPLRLCRHYLRNHFNVFGCVSVYLIIHVILGTDVFLKSQETDTWMSVVANISGQFLNFNNVVSVVLMLRHLLTFLRASRLGSCLPIDYSIYFHKVVGVVILMLSLVHTISHVWNFEYLTTTGNFSLTDYLFTTEPRIGWVAGCASISGWILLSIVCVICAFSLPCIRSRGYFEVFYWTHCLYIPYLLVAVMHAKNFWIWIITPALLFILEKALSCNCVTKARWGKLNIQEVILLPSKVTHIVVNRPANFAFQSGDYVFINIPKLAKYEWHPFTISSSPENKDVLWFHIRGVGTWTNHLYEYFENASSGGRKSIFSKVAHEHKSVSTYRKISHLSSIPVAFRRSQTLSPAGQANDSVFMTVDKSDVNNNGPEQSMHDDVDKTWTAVLKTREKKISTKRNLNPMHHLRLSSAPDLSDWGGNTPNVRMVSTPKFTQLLEVPKEMHRPPSSFSGMPMSKISAYSAYSNGQKFAHLRAMPAILKLHEPHDEPVIMFPDNTHPAAYASYTSESAEPTAVQLQEQFEVFIDGPCWSPSSNIFHAEHAVLIAGGGPVTPFASVLQSIATRYREARINCPQCGNVWLADKPTSLMRLNKVHFIWIAHEQKTFEWFLSLMAQLEIEQAELDGTLQRFLEIHIYVTSSKTDSSANKLKMALDFIHRKETQELVKGLKSRTFSGKPKWNQLFGKISAENKGKVTVFCSGSRQLRREAKKKCKLFGFNFHAEQCFV